jgi:hypothetical protein
VDGETFAAIETSGLAEWIAGLRKELTAKTYRPAPVRRVMIPKPGGGERGVPKTRSVLGCPSARYSDVGRIKHLMQTMIGIVNEDGTSW